MRPDLTVYDVLPGLTVNPGKNGPCPLCGGKDRFYVGKDATSWGCRQCEPSYNSLEWLVVKLNNCSVSEARRRLEAM